MRKVLVSLLVLALCAPAFAEVDVTATDMGDGQLRITVTPSNGAAVRGVGLKLTVLSGDAAVSSSSTEAAVTGLNTNIDWLVTNGFGTVTDTPNGQGHPLANPDDAGVLDLTTPKTVMSLCSGYLDASGGQAGLAVDSFFDVYFDLTVDSVVKIELDGLRGGIVGDDIGTVTLPADITIVPGGCKGDLNGDTIINALDLSALVTYLTPYAPLYEVSPIPAGDEKYDLNGDLKVNALDLSGLVTHLTPYAPLYETTTCMP